MPHLGYFSVDTLTLFRMASEIRDLREENLRLSLCASVDQILAEELERGDESFETTHLPWKDGKFLLGNRDLPQPSYETITMRRPPVLFRTDFKGGRHPRFD